MFIRTKAPMQCRRYEARLEDHLNGAVDPELNEHLNHCANCRTALADSQMAGEWMREAWEPTAEPGSAFLAGVMAKIREEEMRAQSQAAFWKPFEFLTSRLSMTAAALLLAFSVYLAGVAHRRTVTSLPPRTELSATDFPQPPADPVPVNNDEVLQSLAVGNYGH
jgi:hypothetical protein